MGIDFYGCIFLEVLGIPVLAFSIGLYLPIYLSTPIMVGGVIKWFIDNKRKYANDEERKDASDRGVLYAAGMIAGEGIVGIVLAILAVVNVHHYMVKVELSRQLVTG